MNTIVAISTPNGSGGIAVVRVSGQEAVEIVNKIWRGADLSRVITHTAHLGEIIGEDGQPLDTAVVTIFRGPKSFTGENTVEISVHGSKWIQKQVVDRLVGVGARPAEPGEFTRRAFINGRLDLAQAEGVADLIAASSRASHRLAMSQLSGGFSKKLNELRDRLVELASLLELELDFSEEDVEFADRERLHCLTDETLSVIERLASTYKSGRAFKEGVPVVIAGQPNAGKSTLLNSLLGQDKAIVSDVPGTTRDVIDDTVEIGGVLFRFYDTAGLRQTDDIVERIGIDRAYETIDKAAIILWLIDSATTERDVLNQLEYVNVQINAHSDQKHVIVYNKIDTTNTFKFALDSQGYKALSISAKTEEGIGELRDAIVTLAKEDHNPDSELIVTNARHYAALKEGAESLRRAKEALSANLSTDFIAHDIRETIHHLSTLTGEITTDTLLGNIFANFCIGK